MAKRPIVDAHHHLWDLGACHYPWLMARGVTRFFGDPTPIQKNYLADDLRADAKAYEIAASVHIQVGVADGDALAETRWLARSADEHGLPSAIVAYCDLAAADAPRELEQQRRYGRVRGVRQIVGRAAEEDAKTGSDALIDNPRWRENLAALRELGLSFDLQLVPGQMLRMAEVLATMPGLNVALCHSGSPWERSPAGLAAWREGLVALAQLPGVVCKLSGYGMFDHNWTTDSLRPLIETCIEVFGVERAMFGSNFPVDKLHASYGRLYGAYEDIVRTLDEDDQDRLFRRNAAAFYRL